MPSTDACPESHPLQSSSTLSCSKPVSGSEYLSVNLISLRKPLYAADESFPWAKCNLNVKVVGSNFLLGSLITWLRTARFPHRKPFGTLGQFQSKKRLIGVPKTFCFVSGQRHLSLRIHCRKDSVVLLLVDELHILTDVFYSSQ